MTARLILIAHASTESLRRSAFPNDDEPLEERGRKSAEALAGSLPAAEWIWTSPELRTRQTAQALGLDATVEPLLRDCDYGAWRGCTFDEVHAREPEAAAAWLCDPAARPHGGEALADVLQRVAGWLAGLQDHHRRSIAVTHATIIRAAVVHALGAAPAAFWRIDIAPLSITRLSGASNRWNLATVSARLTPYPARRVTV